MRELIEKALAHSRADYAEIRLEREWRTNILYRGRNVDRLSRSAEVGGIVRCLVRGGWGIAVFNSLADLEQRVADAESIARAVSERSAGRVELAPVPPVREETRAELAQDPRTVPLLEKQQLLQRYNGILLGHSPKIVTTSVAYADLFREVTYATSDGTWIVDERPDLTLAIAATARDGEISLSGHEMFGFARGMDAIAGLEDKAQAVARRAVDLLSAPPVQGGVYTVILDPDLTGVFAHEAFGHLCEADFIAKNERLREVLKPGRRFGSDALNIVDDGYLPGGQRGNSRYDDEGTLRRRVYLIKNGILNELMHSRETAARMGAEPTGNARAISYEHEPIVRMRNTYVDCGSASFQDLLKGVERGLYACGTFGGQSMLGQFTFSAGYGYEIVNGQLGGLRREIVLTGNIFETLQNIDMIGDDLLIRGIAGGCGKGSQYPLPVTTGGPHIRIQNVTVGGRA